MDTSGYGGKKFEKIAEVMSNDPQEPKMNLKVFGISIVTDSGVPGEIVEISHEEVQEVAMKAEPKMTLIMKELIKSI